MKQRSIQEKIQYVKDYEEFGEKYVSEKYDMCTIVKIRHSYLVYKYCIETRHYQTITKLINKIDSTKLLQLINDFKDPNIARIELCRKYKIKYCDSHIRKAMCKVCDELGIEYNIGKAQNKYTKEERIEVAKKYLEEGKVQAKAFVIEKYGHQLSSVNSFIRTCIEIYNKEIREFNFFILSDKEKMQLINDFNNHEIKFVIEKYQYHGSENSLYSLISKWRDEFNLPIKNRTAEDKMQMIKEYEEHGVEYIVNKYNYSSARVARTIIYNLRKDFGIKKLIRRTIDEEIQIINEYEEHGATYITSKYGYKDVKSTISKFRKKIKMNPL